MVTDSQLMSELSHKTNFLRELTSEEQQLLKKAMLSIYIDVSNLCNQYGLIYMMSSGTCLGAIRHQGFIPWDDDLDIMMPRADYDKLIELCHQGKLGEKYEFAHPNPRGESNNVFLKIFRKNSKFVELATINTPFPKGIFIDVFCIDSVPNSKFFQILKGRIANCLQMIAVSRLYAQYPSKPLKEFTSLNKKLKIRYITKMIVGTLVGFAPHAKWVYWFEKFVRSSKENRPWGVPAGRKFYNGEIFHKSLFVPTKKAMFEGLEVNVPNDTDHYLKNLYGDYMTLPPVEKRERHFVYDFMLPKD